MLFNLFHQISVQGTTELCIRAAKALKALCMALLLGQSVACTPVMQNASEAVSGAQELLPNTWRDAPATAVDETDLVQWWTQFQDETLTNLIERALVSNNDIAAAQGRLRSARAALESTRGARLPGISVSGDASSRDSVTGPSFNTESYGVGIDAAWEADVFGKLRNSAQAAAVSAEGSEASLYDIQRAIAAEVALNYINLRDAQSRLDVAMANLAIQQENLQIAIWRNSAGIGDALEVEQARTVVAQTKAGIPSLEQSISAAINQIDVLLGEPPGNSARLLRSIAHLPTPPQVIGVGLPADLLERRPDVISAQRSLEAEVIRIGVAQADLYPALRLSGALNTSSNTVGRVFDTSVGSLFAGVTAPIFQAGQIRARIEQQKGSADVALANYRGTILTALQDVENALVATRSARQREAAFTEAEEAALASLGLAEIRYRSGAIDFQTLLDAQRNLLSVQDSRVSASSSRSTEAVQLFKALGGGWIAAQNL